MGADIAIGEHSLSRPVWPDPPLAAKKKKTKNIVLNSAGVCL